ncbi:MAG TPA: hypothetical protein DEH78_17495 [Solibacterales bacterium]|nr:hypothetical protein [Bryobacterales bacterium]
MRWALLFLLLVAGGAGARADVSGCACDPAQPETMKRRECGLCREAENQQGEGVFFLKDINPRKPNRWLALPKRHIPGHHAMKDLTKEERAELWAAAIQKARELWGDEWGLAYNSDRVRTQCHTHIHIGKLLKGLAPGKTMIVNGPADIPALDGIWVHPKGKKLVVHYGEGITETALLR